jgi:hypothetical protein
VAKETTADKGKKADAVPASMKDDSFYLSGLLSDEFGSPDAVLIVESLF